MKRLFLIDAHSLIHRCFHALPPLTAPSGAAIQSIYGLSNILLKITRDEKPDYLAVCFDRPEPTFRKEQFADYKAHRPAAPDELVSQIIEAHRLFDVFGIRPFERPGFEADDLIATLAERYKSEGNLQIVVLTGDLDTLQLVEDDHVVVRTFRKGITDTFIYNESAVRERYGLAPKQLVDYKALVGDPSDNIKGVPGIGPKTASEALKKFGTVEELYRHLGDDPKLRKKFEGTKEEAFQAKSLVVLSKNTPIEVPPLESLKTKVDDTRLAAYFRSLGFDSLVKRLGGGAKPRQDKGSAIQSLLPTKPAARSAGGDAVFILSGQVAADFSSTKPKVGFGLKPLLRELWHAKKDLAPPYFDLGVAFWLLDPDFKEHAPNSMTEKYLGKRWENSASDLAALFAVATEKLRDHALERVFKEIEMPLLPVLARMEQAGISVNAKKLASLGSRIDQKLLQLTRDIYREAGEEFNINSPQQLSRILFEKLKIGVGRVKRTGGGKLSTNAEQLERIKSEHAIIPLVLEYREDFKVQSTYVRAFEKLIAPDGRIHTEFLQTGAATGRLSSQAPNLQNIPQESIWAKELRSVFEAPAGSSFVAFDYSQLELRILAALCGDQKMKKVFEENGDIHKTTAAKVLGIPLSKVGPEERRLAKTLNFGLIYGMGVGAFAEASGLPRAQAQEFIGNYFREFSKVREWQEKLLNDARTSGYVETLTGRRRYLVGITSESDRVVREAERAAVNQPVQGLGADILKLAMAKVAEQFSRHGVTDRDARMTLSIHDELLFEVRDAMITKIVPIVRGAMESAFALGVPLRVDASIGKDWGHMRAFTDI